MRFSEYISGNTEQMSFIFEKNVEANSTEQQETTARGFFFKNLRYSSSKS